MLNLLKKQHFLSFVFFQKVCHYIFPLFKLFDAVEKKLNHPCQKIKKVFKNINNLKYLKAADNGRESAVNRSLDGSTYLG
jgi:hypothetical protein